VENDIVVLADVGEELPFRVWKHIIDRCPWQRGFERANSPRISGVSLNRGRGKNMAVIVMGAPGRANYSKESSLLNEGHALPLNHISEYRLTCN